MQIDFHHAVTYVATRLGGMNHEDASIVAHAAQYVDDATNDGPLNFVDGQRYVRVTSAHKTMDLRQNADTSDNRLVWVPFHFLPGNEAAAQHDDARTQFESRMMCKPNSEIAQQMVIDCIEKQNLSFALHRFGIAMHTYADTWAHQQFVGMVCELNRLKKVSVAPDSRYANSPVYEDLTSGATQIKKFMANHLPVGHAGAVTFPDMPFLKWSFVRDNGQEVVRDNLPDFMAAARGIFNMTRRYVTQDIALPEVDIPNTDLSRIENLLTTTLFVDGESRHQAWLAAIEQGAFSFGPTTLTYVEQGPGSWKFAALGEDPDQESGEELFISMDGFLTSNWKMFHDAVQYHRLFILHDLLPRFGLSAS